jgi:hypothetical protein
MPYECKQERSSHQCLNLKIKMANLLINSYKPMEEKIGKQGKNNPFSHRPINKRNIIMIKRKIKQLTQKLKFLVFCDGLSTFL